MGGGSAGASGGDDRIALNGAALIARRADGLTGQIARWQTR
jgi:hypothetical protein